MKFEKYLDNYRNTENELANFIHNQCDEKLQNQESIKNKINNIEQWNEKIKETKEKFLKNIGGLDFKKSPLNVIETGIINKDKYHIKKIIFESHRNFYVTGNLYVPKNNLKKLPAIILTCGHTSDSKAEIEYQLAAIELVLNGMVVFCIDPPGQGETQILPQREDVKRGTQEHSYIGLSCTLTGTNIARYFIWNIMRAVDFLNTLYFVNKEKIGICGNSGGGTQATYGVCLDNRIKAAAIGCYINGRRQYLRSGQMHDSEQNIYNCMEDGIDYSDFIICAVPKPIIVLSQQYDFFPIEGAIESIKKAKKVYKLHNKEKNIDHVIDKNIHGLTDVLREQLVKWFVKHFTSNKYVSHNLHNYIESREALNCTKTGQVLFEFKNARALSSLIYDEYLITKQRKQPIKMRINKVFNIKLPKKELLERRINSFQFEGHKGEKIFWIEDKQVAVGGIYFHGLQNNECTYILFNEGTQEIEKYQESILKELKKGDVFVFDFRGVGAFKNAPINKSNYYKMHGTINKLVNDSLMAGSSLIEMQINDIISSLNLIKKNINIIAYKKAVLPALIANKIDNRIKNIKTINGIKTFDDIIKGEYTFIPEYEVFNMAKYFDIDELMI